MLNFKNQKPLSIIKESLTISSNWLANLRILTDTCHHVECWRWWWWCQDRLSWFLIYHDDCDNNSAKWSWSQAVMFTGTENVPDGHSTPHLAWPRCRLEVINRDHSKVYPCNVAINNRKAWRRDVFNFTKEGNSRVSEAILILTMATDN